MQATEVHDHPRLRIASITLGSLGLVAGIVGVILAGLIDHAKLKPGEWDMRGLLAIIEVFLAGAVMFTFGTVAMGLAVGGLCRKSWRKGLMIGLVLNAILMIGSPMVLISSGTEPGWATSVGFMFVVLGAIAFPACCWIARNRAVPGILPMLLATICLVLPAGLVAVFFASGPWN